MRFDTSRIDASKCLCFQGDEPRGPRPVDGFGEDWEGEIKRTRKGKGTGGEAKGRKGEGRDRTERGNLFHWF